jgi:hypothetical protein
VEEMTGFKTRVDRKRGHEIVKAVRQIRKENVVSIRTSSRLYMSELSFAILPKP